MRRGWWVAAVGILVAVFTIGGYLLVFPAEEEPAFCDRLLRDDSASQVDSYDRFSDLADEAPEEIAADLRAFAEFQRSPRSGLRGDVMGNVNDWATENCDNWPPEPRSNRPTTGLREPPRLPVAFRVASLITEHGVP
jgi:hypothetical protein